jgi:calpain-15
MAEHPENIVARFYTKTINKAGIYMMIFFINGLEQAVIVDDYIPVRDGKPCFASTKNGELWVILLEKAWAKIQGTYARTEAGSPNTAAFHLIGVPNMYYLTNETDTLKLWHKIVEADRRGFIIDSVTKGEGENKGEQGIISGHVYSLISAHEVLDDGV